ncbi:MATE family efflux transporter [Neobacillus sp. Marseille-QA0830]
MFLELVSSPAISLWTIRQRYDFRYKSVVLVTIIILLINSVFGVIAVLISEEKGTARILSSILVTLIFGLIIYINNIRKANYFIVWKYVKFAILFNIPLIPHYISAYILSSSDRIMIQKMSGLDKAGIYGVAYNIGLTMTMVTTSINNAITPWQYRKLEQKDFKTIGEYFNQIMVVIMIPIALFIAFAPEVVKVLASSEYYEAVYVIPPVAASTFFILMYGLFSNVEYYYEANKFTMYVSGFGAVLNVVLNYFFIKLFGYVAAGYTTLFCYIIFTFTHYAYSQYIVKKREGYIIFSPRAVIILTLLMVGITILLSLSYKYFLLGGMV